MLAGGHYGVHITINELNTNLDALQSEVVFNGASGVQCDNTSSKDITFTAVNSHNALVITGYVENVTTSFFSIAIPYAATLQAVIPIFNNGTLTFLLNIAIASAGKIRVKSVYSGNTNLKAYITRIVAI